jgi:hypothetical protein
MSVQDIKRYTPTHFLGNLIANYDGNIVESNAVREVNSVIQRYIDYMQLQHRDPVIHKSPLGNANPNPSLKIDGDTKSADSPSASKSSTTKTKRICNPFLDKFPEWAYDYEYYSSEVYRDTLAIAFMQTFDMEFNFVPYEQQCEWLKQIKFDILTEFHKQRLYQSNSYSASTDFKKSDLEDVFTTNKNISISMIRVFADVFGIYLIWLSSDGILHCPSICTNPKNIVWILVEDSNGGWYVLYPDKSSGHLYYQYKDIVPYMNSVIPKTIPANIALLNLEELQLWSRLRGIDHKKEGKTGKRNKLKEELLEGLQGTTSSQ